MIRALKYTIFIILLLFLSIYSFLILYLWNSENKAAKSSIKSSHYVTSNLEHDISLIDSGIDSLKHRINLIDSAKNSIELEYFIYELDLAAQTITYKLIEAAKRGVKVKVLVDTSAPIFKLQPEYANFLKNENIEVKYYNLTPISNFINVQHRSHRKFLIIDSNKLISGGRNIANDYFDLSKEYNFLDSDIFISGPIVKDVQKSFLDYWNSDISQVPNSKVKSTDLNFVDLNKIQKLLSSLKASNRTLKLYKCSNMDFVTDSPGVEAQNRKVFKYISKRLENVNESIDVESPYFVLREDGLNLMKALTKKGIKQTYLTNSLFSTDAYYTVSTIVGELSAIKSTNAQVMLYNGSLLNQQKETKINRWGLHAKRAVLDKKHILIGTYNIDPRSANLNSEVLFACNNNPEIANAMLENMKNRRKNAWNLFAQKRSPLENLTQKTSFMMKLKFYLFIPISTIFKILL